ncbi:hypothetical protein AAG570_000047 [Ranatra chinensis]|uniref:Mff-like domain-containing protein n=1 Tax=Ranatra chinensis TaxID=642074 RepID=A0ABD0YVZ0_9HEMI
MRVPKRIKVDGESDDPPMVNGGPNFNSWPYGEKFDMRVPEKIVVLGYDKHMGAKALPREFELENAIPPPDPALIRVQTPPRVITLDKHCFPSVVDDMVPPPLYGNHIQDHQVMGGSRVHRGYMADVMAVPTHNGHHHIGDMSSATLK